MNYVVYRITNPKKHVYIGITKRLKSRWREYRNLHCKAQFKIYKSLETYGVQNHKFEIFMDKLDLKSAQNVEKALIKIYKEIKVSLNVSDGGDCNKGKQRDKILQFSLKGRLIKKWNSQLEVENEIDISASSLGEVLRAKSFYCKGFLWIYESEYNSGVIPYWKFQHKTTLKRQVHQYTLEGNFIRTFSSPDEASVFTNIKANTIRAACHRQNKTCGGFMFSFTNSTKIDVPENKQRKIKTVHVYDVDWNLLDSFDSISSLSNKYGVSKPSLYYHVSKGGQLFKNQYRFSYEQH